MMTRRAAIQAAAGGMASPFLSRGAGGGPNIVLIVTDDQGWWDVGFNGNPHIETPAMNRLAQEGVSFSRFYASPVCAPTRASLMTGRYHLRTGVYNTRFGGDSMHLGEVTIAELLRQRGYRTGIFGKWHLGRYSPYWPQHRGFDEALTFFQGHLERYTHPDQLYWNGHPIQARGYISDILTDAAIGFVRANAARPFFLYLPFNVPHEPNYVAEPYVEKYLKKGLTLKDAGTYGMLSQCDENIARLMKAIDDTKLRDDTVVIFMSDNGGLSRFWRGGLRGSKASAYEGGVRVPCAIRWPGHFPAGARVDAIGAHIDLLPTICELTGAKLPQDRVIDGKSLLPLLSKGRGESPHDYLFHIWDRFYPRTDTNCGMSGTRWKLAHNQVFDLASDPGESRDISKDKPDLARELKQRYEAWFKDVTAGKKYEPVAIPVGHADENPVEIQASWAKISGAKTNYTFAGYDWDSIDGWRNAGDMAQWKLNVVQAGNYEVVLSYGCTRQNAGGTFELSAGGRKLKGKVEATPDRSIFERRPLGQLKLARGAATLEVTATAVPGDELMTLNRIWLRRI